MNIMRAPNPAQQSFDPLDSAIIRTGDGAEARSSAKAERPLVDMTAQGLFSSAMPSFRAYRKPNVFGNWAWKPPKTHKAKRRSTKRASVMP